MNNCVGIYVAAIETTLAIGEATSSLYVLLGVYQCIGTTLYDKVVDKSYINIKTLDVIKIYIKN